MQAGTSARGVVRLQQQHASPSSCFTGLRIVRRAAQMCRASTDTTLPSSTTNSPPARPAAPQPRPTLSEQQLVPDAEFSITKVSYGSILTPLGVGLLTYGFGAFFLLLPGADISSLMLIYGFPVSVLGFALSYAQLSPVPCKTTQAAFALRASQMTDIQKQVREDVTRYRYGDEQHLEEALDKVFRIGKSGGLTRKNCPKLVGVREEVMDSMYTLVLEFESKIEMSEWDSRQPKLQSFFGPGVVAKLTQVVGGVDVALICDGTGAGRGGKEKKDVNFPLMPGVKPKEMK